mmetsp:Transcript_18766/g.59888  ORF Transcript_18766/g.59888 Transcript_18766/m.59888 type:complete len:82 (-) Transcript_18766:1353-1598(-)
MISKINFQQVAHQHSAVRQRKKAMWPRACGGVALALGRRLKRGHQRLGPRRASRPTRSKLQNNSRTMYVANCEESEGEQAS